MKTADEYAYVGGTAELAWVNLSDSFRRACALYHEGREAEAMQLARDELPELLEQWSAVCNLDGHARRLRLMSMFVEEGRKVGESSLAQKMLASHMTSQARLASRTRELLRNGGSLTGGIRLLAEEARQEDAAVPMDEFTGCAAMQMIR
jgi:hypothetical protein